MKPDLVFLKKKRKKQLLRCIRPTLWSAHLSGRERQFILDMRNKLSCQRGFKPTLAELRLLEGLIEHILTPEQIERAMLSQIGSRAKWVEQYGRGFGAA